MAGVDRTKLTFEEFERLSKQYAIGKEDERDIWPVGPTKYEQGKYLAVRRIARFAGFSLVSSLPAAEYNKYFSPAYLPFAARHSALCMTLAWITVASGVVIYGRKQ